MNTIKHFSSGHHLRHVIFMLAAAMLLCGLALPCRAEKSANALFQEALHYEDGNGVPQDYAKAMELYQEAAQGGLGVAMNNIGYMYQHGEGVTVDYEQAMQWFAKGAQAGYTGGWGNIGYMYEHGQGVKKDYTEAMKAYLKGAELGDGGAMNSIGILYYRGLGVERDYTQAAEWVKKSADTGNPYGMYDLANDYENGTGVPKDLEKARELYTGAAKLGNKEAGEWLANHRTVAANESEKPVNTEPAAAASPTTNTYSGPPVEVTLAYYFEEGKTEQHIEITANGKKVLSRNVDIAGKGNTVNFVIKLDGAGEWDLGANVTANYATEKATFHGTGVTHVTIKGGETIHLVYGKPDADANFAVNFVPDGAGAAPTKTATAPSTTGRAGKTGAILKALMAKLDKRYADKDHGCSYVPPKGWEKKVGSNGATKFFTKGGTNFSVLSPEYPGTLREFADANLAEIKKAFPEVEVVSDDPFNTTKGAAAFRVKFKNKVNGNDLVQIMYFIQGQDKHKIMLTATMASEDAPTNEATFDACAGSVVVVP